MEFTVCRLSRSGGSQLQRWLWPRAVPEVGNLDRLAAFIDTVIDSVGRVEQLADLGRIPERDSQVGEARQQVNVF